MSAPAQKLLGLIGGVSPESTAIYYRLLNDAARRRLGGSHSARLMLWSFDFAAIDAAYRDADWKRYEALVVEAGLALKRAGAEGLMICSNTTHLAANTVKDATGLPLVHIIDALAASIEARGAKKPFLLGTPLVMSDGFYRSDLRARFGVETIVPDADDRAEALRIILDELVHDKIIDASKKRLLAMIEKARGEGADGVILGCTELWHDPVAGQYCDLPVFDTTALIHAAGG